MSWRKALASSSSTDHACDNPSQEDTRRTGSDTSCHCSRTIPHVAPWQAGHAAPTLAILQESLLQMKHPLCSPGCQMLPTHCCSPRGSAPVQVGTGPAANLLWGMQPRQHCGSEGHTPLSVLPSVKVTSGIQTFTLDPSQEPFLQPWVSPSPSWWMHPPEMLPVTPGTE